MKTKKKTRGTKARVQAHKKKLGSAIYPHVHYIQGAAQQPTFKMYYRYYNNSGTVPSVWNTGSTADGNKGLFTYITGSVLQIATFLAIDPPAGESVSANLDVKLFRADNDVTGDVLAKYVDFHIELDSTGSYQQFSKT